MAPPGSTPTAATPAPATPAPATPIRDDDARFRRGLAGLALFGAVSQVLIQTQAFGGNPMVLVPQVDAAVLWSRAGEIAAGDVIGAAPYDTAPLLLWATAITRALGGGLAALGAFQSLLLVATSIVIARTARSLARRVAAADGDSSSAAVGLLAGALFLLLDEPAAGTSRVLAGTLQLFVVSLLLSTLVSGLDDLTARRAGVIGLLTGLAALAFPPFLGLVPVLALWIWLRSSRTWRCSGVFLAASVLAIAPATIHNVIGCGEPITISAQAGLTFYHGNNEHADGTFAAVGVVNSKEDQALDSLARARIALGDDEADWRDASRYWFGQGLEWWGDEPGHATKIAARKLWYALSGRHYGDVYQPWMERDDGVASRLWLAPVPLAWIVPVALMALFGLVRRIGFSTAFPWLLLLVVPFAVCVVFWYTPRYRLPAAVVLVPLAALALGRMARGGRGAVSLAVAAMLGIGSGFLNRAIGFDEDPLHARRHAARMAAAYGELEMHDEGLAYLRRDMELAPEDAEATNRVVLLLLSLGRDADAALTIEDAPPAVRDLPGARSRLAWIRASSADADARDGEAALRLAEGLIAELGPDPGLLDLRAAARARVGDHEGAAYDARAAISALTQEGPLRTSIEGRLALYEAGQPYTSPSRRQP